MTTVFHRNPVILLGAAGGAAALALLVNRGLVGPSAGEAKQAVLAQIALRPDGSPAGRPPENVGEFPAERRGRLAT